MGTSTLFKFLQSDLLEEEEEKPDEETSILFNFLHPEPAGDPSLSDDGRSSRARATEEAIFEEGARFSLKDPPIVRSVKSGFAQVGFDAKSLAQRVLGDVEGANQTLKEAEALGQLNAQADEFSDIPGTIQRGIRSMISSLTQLGILAPTGPIGIIGGFGLSRFNQALAEADRAGLDEAEAISFATKAGTIEAGITAIFQGIGRGGLEAMFGKGVSTAAGLEAAKTISKRGIKEGLKKVGKRTIEELAEEEIITFLDLANQKVSDVNPEAFTAENIAKTLSDAAIDTFTATVMTVGAAHGGLSVVNRVGTRGPDSTEEIRDAQSGANKDAQSESRESTEERTRDDRLVSEQFDPEAGVEAATDTGRTKAQVPDAETSEAVTPQSTEGTERGKVNPSFPVDRIELDPKRFQFKLSAGPEGTTGSLSDVQSFDPNLAGIVQVYQEPESGRVFVVNGHNRVVLAQQALSEGQSDAETIPVRFLDVESESEARAVGALTNIAEGRGTSLDAAKFFRDTGLSREDLQEKGIPLRENTATEGLGLANLAPALFNRVVEGDLSVRRGALIGEKLSDENIQLQLVDEILREENRGRKVNDATVNELIDQINVAPVATETQETLFGDETRTRSLAFDRARLVSTIRGRLGKDKRLFALVSKNAAGLERGGNVIDSTGSAAVSSEAAVLLDIFDRVKDTKGPVSDVLNRAAERIGSGEDAKTVTKEAFEEIRAPLSEVIIRPKAKGPGRSEGDTADAEVQGPGQAAVADVDAGQSDLFSEASTPSPESKRVASTGTGAVGFPAPTAFPSNPVDEPRSLNPHAMPMRLEAPRGIVRSTSAKKVITALAEVVKVLGGTTPIRVGRIPPQIKALGIFKVQPEVIRIQTANDILTATHEVGHAMQAQIWGFPKGSPFKQPQFGSVMQRELARLGRNLYGDQKPKAGYKAEGFAEFIRIYVTDRDSASKQVPRFSEWFTKTYLAENPNVSKALDGATELAVQWQEQGSFERAKASIVDPASPRERIKKAGRGAKKFLSFTSQIDSLQPLNLFVRQAKKKLESDLPSNIDPFFIAQALRGTHSEKVRVMIDETMIDIASNPIGPPLRDVGAIIGKKSADFKVYLWAKRAEALWFDPNRGPRNPGISHQDAQQIISELETDNFKLAAAKVYDWNDAVLNYAAQASPTFAEIVNRIREVDPGNYIPLARDFDEIDSIWARSTTTNSKTLVKRLKGSGRGIKDPFPQMISNAVNIVRAAHTRMIYDQVLRLSKLPGMGNLVEEVPKGQVPVVSREIFDLIDQINKQIGGGLQLSDDVNTEDIIGEIITFFAPAMRPSGKDNVVPIWSDGKMKWFEIEPKLFDAMNALDSFVTLPDVLGFPVMDWMFGKPARLFRLGTTGLRASFSLVTNPLRDLPNLWVNTQSNANAFQLFSSWAKALVGGFIDIGTFGQVRNETRDAFIRLAGQMSQPLGPDLAQTRNLSRAVFQGRVMHVLDPRNAMSSIQKIFSIPESAPRVAEIERVAKQIGWEPGKPMTLSQSLELSLALKQVTTDFTAAGTVGRFMNQIVPFFNAAIQGPRANVRALKRNPVRFMAKGMAMAAASLGLWWQQKDEDWWTELDERERNMFWWFPVDWPEKTLVRIPKPFELGQIFSSLPVSFADAFYRQNPELMKEWWDTFRRTSSPVDSVPSLFGPLVVEAFAQAKNRDAFWESPIVPGSLQNLPEKEQFNEFTTRAAIVLGDLFNVSPKRIDHAIPGIGGPVAKDLLEVVGLGAAPRNLEQEATDIPVFGTLFRRGGRAGTSPRSIEKVYDLLAEAKKRQFSRANPETLDERDFRLRLTDATRAMSSLFAVRRETVSKEKRQELTQAAKEIAREVLDPDAAPRVYLARQIREFTNSRILNTDRKKGESLDKFRLRQSSRDEAIDHAERVLMSLDTSVPDLLKQLVEEQATKSGKTEREVLRSRRTSTARLTAFGKRYERLRRLESKRNQ